MKVVNTYEKVRDNWFKWSVSIEGMPQELKNVRHVTYLLHESFPNRRIVSTNSSNNFARSLEGWGEFLLRAEAIMKNGGLKYAYLWLDLGFRNTRYQKERYNGIFSSQKLDVDRLPTDKKTSERS